MKVLKAGKRWLLLSVLILVLAGFGIWWVFLRDTSTVPDQPVAISDESRQDLREGVCSDDRLQDMLSVLDTAAGRDGEEQVLRDTANCHVLRRNRAEAASVLERLADLQERTGQSDDAEDTRQVIETLRHLHNLPTEVPEEEYTDEPLAI